MQAPHEKRSQRDMSLPHVSHCEAATPYSCKRVDVASASHTAGAMRAAAGVRHRRRRGGVAMELHPLLPGAGQCCASAPLLLARRTQDIDSKQIRSRRSTEVFALLLSRDWDADFYRDA